MIETLRDIANDIAASDAEADSLLRRIRRAVKVEKSLDSSGLSNLIDCKHERFDSEGRCYNCGIQKTIKISTEVDPNYQDPTNENFASEYTEEAPT